MLKILKAKKTDDWYQQVRQMYLTATGALSIRPDFREKEKLYQFFHNNLSQYVSALNEICNDAITQEAAEDTFLAYNKIKNKYDILDGELLRQGNNHKIMVMTAKAVRAKNEEFIQRIQTSVEKDLQLIFSKAVEELKAMSPEQIQKYLEEQRQILTPRDIRYKNFLSDVEIYKNKMLKYIWLTDDILDKKRETFQHQFIMSEFYLKNSWMHGKPSITVLNPLYCEYNKSGNEAKVSKADWFKYSEWITIGQAMDHYMNVLTDDMLEKLIGQGYQGHFPDKSDITTLRFDTSQFRLAQELYGNRWGHLYSGTHETTNNNQWFLQKIKKTDIEFKAWDEMVFYTQKDMYGDKIQVILEDGVNIIPKHASKVKYTNEYFEEDDKWIWADEMGEHEVIVKWIPQRYEMTELQNGVLINKRKVPFQPQNFENPVSAFTLSYKGLVTNNLNSKACSRMESAIPAQLQILALKQLQNKAMGKYQGFVLGRDIRQIPKSLAEDEKDILTTVKVIEKKTGESYFDSNASANGFHNPQQGAPLIPMQLGDPNEFMILQRAIEMLDIEVGLNCGVSPAREGQIVQGTNVTDNQQSLIQTTLATQKDYYEHGQVWTEALNESLHAWDIYFQNHFEKNPDDDSTVLEYITPDGTKELISVLPDYTKSQDYGIFLTSTYSDTEYKQLMEARILQNTNDIDMATASAISKAIKSGASAEEIHREIQMMVDANQKRAEEMQKMEMQSRQQNIEDQKALAIFQSQLKVQEAKEIARAQQAGKVEIARIDAERFALQADIDKSGVNDDLEKERMKIEAEREKQEKQFKHEKEMLDKEIQGKKEIERAKPKPTTKNN